MGSKGPTENRIKLPGFGLPFNRFGDGYGRAATLTARIHALGQWNHALLTVREKCMLFFINKISDKPEWTRKVHDESIVAKWKQEAMSIDWRKAGIKDGDMSNKMFDYCIEELKEKAAIYENHGFMRILDSTSGVFKSDSMISSELKDELRKAVEPLEKVSEHRKDWHPGSDGKVLDLVHPSLFPLVYQRSRILPDSTINVDNCLQSIGEGIIVPNPVYDPAIRTDEWVDNRFELWSSRFQWLPCDVSFPDGENAKIDSYINNLHPKNEDLYRVIEKIITKAVPLWNLVCQTYDGGRFATILRIPCGEVTWDYPEDLNTNFEDSGMTDLNVFYDWLEEQRVLKKPEPKEYQPLQLEDPDIRLEDKDIQDKFAFTKGEKKIQVIVKLANIHLTPEKPTYDGGTWHIEGQLNERIVATALYYYDNHNITDSQLAFRTKVSDSIGEGDVTYEQDDTEGIEMIFGVHRDEPTIQELGSVLTREGRLIAFPNGFQHRVGRFQLQDPEKPGHRKILALFLVAPDDPVISTANIPPQQHDWWVDEFAAAQHNPEQNRLASLPTELVAMIGEKVEWHPISLDEAKTLREELMSERSRMDSAVNNNIADMEFNFCEH